MLVVGLPDDTARHTHLEILVTHGFVASADPLITGFLHSLVTIAIQTSPLRYRHVVDIVQRISSQNQPG